MNPKKTVISLRHIAERVGVSRMTVSQALRDDGRISSTTRERVRAVARELGFEPNPHLSTLMAETARTRHGVSGEVLAFMTSEPTRDGWKRYASGIFEASERRAVEYGFRLEPWWIADPDMTPARVNQIIKSRGIRGMIIPNVSHQFFADRGGTLPIEWERFCVVEIGGSLRKPAIHHVQHDHQSGLFMALERLEAHGYRRIGLCLRSEDDQRTHHRWSGAYVIWRRMRGYETKLQPLIAEEYEPMAVRRWIRKNRLEAVISPGVLPLQEWGLSVPEKLGFASLDLWGKGAMSVAGIDQQRVELAAAAVDMLMTLLWRNQRGVPEQPMSLIIPGRWVEGETVRQRRSIHLKPIAIEDEQLVWADRL
ncbi:MAG: LacI family DNA-binding transcriptional regulator [bacterium]